MSLNHLNTFLNRVMPLITPASVVIGVLLADFFDSYTFLVVWLFAFMTFSGSLSSNFTSLKHVLAHPSNIIVALLILHVIMPLWAWSVGHIAFPGDVFTITGLVLAVVIPTGVTSFLWVTIYKGNFALALSIILIDTFLSPFIVPASMAFILGESIEMDVLSMMKGLFGMVVIPSLLGMICNQITKGKINEKLGAPLAPFSKIALGIVVMINSSTIAPYLKNIDAKLVFTALIVFLVAATGYILAWLIGKLLKWERDEIISLVFTGGMRNISSGAVIAVAYFPPAVAVPVVIGILFQQVLASLFGYLLEKSFSSSKNTMATAKKRDAV
ncbi:bile acid:sodium symporter family protein [Bacillus dakarensis]|uniref:bile acid:sodium symporter family protein n=1 Tax=Robertmurraya dakarensis TaxID=1926278 RepID=UPI000982303B|nr:bile acid:sodium symporter family protein [Bacillus dakarensis]